MNYKGFNELECYIQARLLRKYISELVKKFPGHEKYLLTAQLVDSSRSVTRNIAEGYGRFTFIDTRNFFIIARGSVTETMDHLLTAYDERYINEEELKAGHGKCELIFKLINGYITYLERSKAKIKMNHEPHINNPNEKAQFLIPYLLHLADNSLILGHRNSEWCGHGPILEQDIALTNISLDLIGQARNFYQYAATIAGDDTTEDTLAYLREAADFKHCLLAELPKGDWAFTILRQFIFSNYQYLLYQELQKSKDAQLAAIATKSLKEVSYHLRWSSEWVIRLGDGTAESHERISNALEVCWPYTNEFFDPAEYEQEAAVSRIGVYPADLKQAWDEKVKQVFTEATLKVPGNIKPEKGGKQGQHTEHLDSILADLQYLQRTYPHSQW